MDYRYQLEHRFIPEALYSEDCERLITSLLTKRGEFLIDVLNFLGRDTNYQCPYKESDFQFKPILVGRDGDPNQFAVLEIDMPEPDVSPLCHRLFICHDASFQRLMYLTYEKGLEGNKILCGWNADGAHLNYGAFTGSEEELFYRIIGIYTNGESY